MKNLGKLKLKQLKKEELERREMNALKGGCSCGTACGCGSDGSWSGGCLLYTSPSPRDA